MRGTTNKGKVEDKESGALLMANSDNSGDSNVKTSADAGFNTFVILFGSGFVAMVVVVASNPYSLVWSVGLGVYACFVLALIFPIFYDRETAMKYRPLSSALILPMVLEQTFELTGLEAYIFG